MSKVPLLTITKENDDWYDRKKIIINASLHEIKINSLTYIWFTCYIKYVISHIDRWGVGY
jgi:hypothetical protein